MKTLIDTYTARADYPVIVKALEGAADLQETVYSLSMNTYYSQFPRCRAFVRKVWENPGFKMSASSGDAEGCIKRYFERSLGCSASDVLFAVFAVFGDGATHQLSSFGLYEAVADLFDNETINFYDFKRALRGAAFGCSVLDFSETLGLDVVTINF